MQGVKLPKTLILGQKIPEMTDEIITSISERYIELYEKIVGEKFEKGDISDTMNRVEKNINNYLQSS